MMGAQHRGKGEGDGIFPADGEGEDRARVEQGLAQRERVWVDAEEEG